MDKTERFWGQLGSTPHPFPRLSGGALGFGAGRIFLQVGEGSPDLCSGSLGRGGRPSPPSLPPQPCPLLPAAVPLRLALLLPRRGALLPHPPAAVHGLLLRLQRPGRAAGGPLKGRMPHHGNKTKQASLTEGSLVFRGIRPAPPVLPCSGPLHFNTVSHFLHFFVKFLHCLHSSSASHSFVVIS